MPSGPASVERWKENTPVSDWPTRVRVAGAAMVPTWTSSEVGLNWTSTLPVKPGKATVASP